MSDYIKHNKANWDDRAPLHAASRDYAVQSFVDDPRFLSEVVRFDLPPGKEAAYRIGGD